MKNKYQKLHRIVIGRSGSGKSFSILSNIKKDKKINIICYPEAISAYTGVYEKAFPEIFLKYRYDTIRTMYTGEYYATGDYILVADTVNGNKEIYRWHRS